MFEKMKIESKNIKKFYVPRIMVIYFNDCDLKMFDNFSKNVVEYVEFVQIGHSFDEDKKTNTKKYVSKNFYSWDDENKKDSTKIMKPTTFFNIHRMDLIEKIKSMDMAIIAYQSSSIEVLEYVTELVHILDKNDVFSFHLIINNFVRSEKCIKMYDKFVKYLKKKRQVYIPINEDSIIETYKKATISTRKYYANLYINNLIDLFISPYLDPRRNQDAFSKTKALFYQSKNNFEKRVITSIGYSEDNTEYLDLALIQALSSPMFAAAFEASNTFIVNVKMPFFTEQNYKRIEEVLKSIVGEWKQFYVLTYVGSFDSYKYCEISIMAINVDESKLITNTDEIQKSIKKILNNVQKFKNIFESNKTKEILLPNKRIDFLSDK